MTSSEATTVASFTAVDASADRASLVAALDEQATLPAIERLRATALDLLAPRAGDRLLDAGCGTGDVARRLAAVVAPTGRVVGVDASTTMLTEARRRGAEPTLPSSSSPATSPASTSLTTCSTASTASASGRTSTIPVLR